MSQKQNVTESNVKNTAEELLSKVQSNLERNKEQLQRLMQKKENLELAIAQLNNKIMNQEHQYNVLRQKSEKEKA